MSAGMDYRSIFLADDWAHQAYYGWRVVADEPGARLLHKRQALFDRYLVLLSAEGADAVPRLVRENVSKRAIWSQIVIHDFADVLPKRPTICGLSFSQVEHADRLLNTATIVIRLDGDRDEVLQAMGSKSRNMVRRALSQGLTVEKSPDVDTSLRLFGQFSERVVKKYGLRYADLSKIHSMVENDNVVIFDGRNPNGEICNVTIVYTAADTGYYMYGANADNLPPGMGQFIHVEVMDALRRRGLKWYDLGGVASTDASDSIFRFKNSFGGSVVQLGTEWRHTGALFSIANASRRLLAHVKEGRLASA